jgi:hypothetical protein
MNEAKGRLPKFLCIGVPRSGTTWLYQNLKAHPEAFVPENKEVTFFVPLSYRSNYHKGIEWYKSQFVFHNDGLIKTWGELSPRYYFSEGTPELIASIVPDIKIIYLLRHPVEVLYSLYMYHVKMYFYAIDANRYKFHDYLDHHLVEPLGYFAKYLKLYYQYFPREAILVRFYEDLRGNSSQNFKAIASFLNIDPSFVVPTVKDRVNTAVVPKYYTLSLLTSYLPNRLPLRNVMLRIEKKYNRIEYRSKKNNDYITPELFSHLISIYRRDIIELETMLNIDLSKWLNYESLDSSMRE